MGGDWGTDRLFWCHWGRFFLAPFLLANYDFLLANLGAVFVSFVYLHF